MSNSRKTGTAIESKPNQAEGGRASAEGWKEAAMPTTPALEAVLRKTDDDDLRWFFNDAEAELTPPSSFNAFEQQVLVGGCQLGFRESAGEPTDAQIRAATRERRIRRILEQLPRESVRVLQRWTTPQRYVPEAVWTLFGRYSGIAMLLCAKYCAGGDATLVMLCEEVRKKDEANVSRLEKRAAINQLGELRKAAESAMGLAIARYIVARGAHDAKSAKPAAAMSVARAKGCR